MKRIYISDLDGTLLNSQGYISDYTIKTINDLVERGMIFTYATARSLVSAAPVTKGLTKNLPLIIYNGTFIVNVETGKIIHKNVFNNDQVSLVKQIMDKYSIKPMVYALVNDRERVTIINEDLHPGTKHYLNNRKNDYRMNLTNNGDELYQGDIFYFTIINDKERLEQYWLEIMPKSASKANAILKLKEILGCDEVISFGDAINDIPMFEISDQCYAMENAVSKLKEKATAVIKSNDQDGVAKWLIENYK